MSLNSMAQVQLIFTITPPSCPSCADASIETTVSGCLNGAYTFVWYGPTTFAGFTPNITDIIAGVYSFTVTDSNGTEANADVAVPSSGSTFTQTENVMIDCVSGGGSPTLRLIFFPPSGLGELGEACALHADCSNLPILYEWFDNQGILISTSDCITSVPSGIYILTVTDSDGLTGTFTVDMTEGNNFGILSVDFCEPSSTLDFNETLNISISPNPNQGNLTLKCEDCPSGSTYLILDNLGREILNGRVQGISSIIDLARFNEGVYQLIILSQDGSILNASRVIRLH